MGKRSSTKFVSRGGEKLDAALQEFGINPTGLTCADLGCNVGGFTDCLLQCGATKVYAIDTGYGALAWTLRKDDRVVVMERTNALHVTLPEAVSLVTIDVAWTRQHLIVQSALRLLSPHGMIVSLIKPHYEAEKRDLRRGVLDAGKIDDVLKVVEERLKDIGVNISQLAESPILGQKGNKEFLALIKPPTNA